MKFDMPNTERIRTSRPPTATRKPKNAGDRGLGHWLGLRLGLNAVGIEMQRHRKSSDYGVIDSSMRNGEGDGTANER
jgi:hypothetical protein